MDLGEIRIVFFKAKGFLLERPISRKDNAANALTVLDCLCDRLVLLTTVRGRPGNEGP